MISAYTYSMVGKRIEAAQQTALSIAPSVTFVLKSIDDDFIHFDLIARQGSISETEKRDLLEKTYFEKVAIDDSVIYQANLKMRINFDGVFKN